MADRSTLPPTSGDARALAISAAYLGPWQEQARGVVAVLDGRSTRLPDHSEQWLRGLATEDTRRGALARKLLDMCGGTQ